MIKQSLKGLLISSTVLLAFMGISTIKTDTVHATPENSVSNADKKSNEDNLTLLTQDIELTQAKVENLLDLQEEKLQEKQKLSNEISDIKVKVDKKKKEISAMEKSLDTLTVELNKVEKDLATFTNDLKKSEDSLKDLEKEITKRKEIVSNRLRSVQVNGNKQPTVVDALMSGKSVDAVISDMINISTIKNAENEMMDSLSELEKEQAIKVKVVKVLRDEIASKKGSLDVKYKDLTSKKEKLDSEKETLIKEQKEFNLKIEKSEEDLYDTANEIKENKDMVDNLQKNIDEVLANLDAIKDAERIAELDRIQSQLTAYSSGEITYRPTFLTDIKTETDSLDAQQKIIQAAENYLGVPYVWGGTTPNGFDCSGFTQYVYKEALGISLPRVTTQQDDMGVEVSLADIQVGDLIFWGDPSYHVAIYAGDGYYIHAPSTGDVVKYANRPLNGASFIRRIL